MEVCRLCLDLATASDVKKLEGTYKDATQIVLPELNTDISSSPVICQPCTSSLDELYAFKASVVEAEHQIKEKVGDDKCQLQLKEVMTGVKIDKDADLGKSKDRMCRTCLCAIEGETFTVLKPTQTDAYLNSMLLMCLPEMDLELTLDPVMCEQCLCHLQKLYHFKSSCLDVEERLNNYCQQHGTSSSNQINLHSVLEEDAAESKHNDFAAVKSEPIDSSVGDYKSEEDDEDVSMSDNSKDLGYTVVKVKKEERDMALKEEDDTEDGDESMGDDDGNITDEEIGELKQEELKIEDDEGDGSKKQWLCKQTGCKMRFAYYRSLREHKYRVHGIYNNRCHVFKCLQCPYKTTIKHNIDEHMLVHNNIRKFPCNLCPYKAKTLNHLKGHMLKHKDIGNAQTVFKCDQCDFKSVYRFSVKKHILNIHTAKAFECEYCDFQSNYQYAINRHLLKHNRQGVMLPCRYCPFQCPNPAYLLSHVKLAHQIIPASGYTKTDLSRTCTKPDNSSGGDFYCSFCAFKNPRKSTVTRHIENVHFNISKHKCDLCEYTAKSNFCVKVHKAKMHQSEEGLPEFKCEKCDYKSIYKSRVAAHDRTVHEGARKYNCNFCEYKTNREHCMVSHLKRAHNRDAEKGFGKE